MDWLKSWFCFIKSFGESVVQWRSAFTIPYIMAINFTFCIITFYVSTEKQIYFLYGFVGFIVSTDLLFSSTRDHSIIYKIVTWPYVDFFKTFSVIFSSLAVYQLNNDQKEKAFVCSATSVLSFIINPVYKFNKVNKKIWNLLNRIKRGLKYFLTFYFVRPILIVFEWLKYFLLFRWILPLLRYFRSLWALFCKKMDVYLLQYIRTFANRCIAIIQYWIYFYWLTDLKRWSKRVIFDPLYKKFLKLFNAFVYVVGCYWLVPVLKELGKVIGKISKHTILIFQRVLILFGIYVLQPVLAGMCAQLKIAFDYFYLAAIQPIIFLCYKKYKFIEDLIFIYLLGPFFKKIIDIVPEKNPFSEITYEELNEYLPKSISLDESGAESDRSSMKSLGSIESDEKEFIPSGFNQVNISCSDSDESEFSLTPTKRRSKRNKHGKSKTIYPELNFEDHFS